jgi:hypothetical protein
VRERKKKRKNAPTNIGTTEKKEVPHIEKKNMLKERLRLTERREVFATIVQ